VLTETTKSILARTVSDWRKEEGNVDFLQECGPAKLLSQIHMDQGLCSPTPDDPDNVFVTDVQAHRAEAERFLAGLLGMM